MLRNFAQRGGWWVAGQGVLLVALVVLALRWHGQWHDPVVTVGGVGLLIIAAVCGVAGARALGRNLTPFPQPASESRLVRCGIYGRIRHPLYTAVIAGALGWALVRASWPALCTALVLGVFLDAKARLEERWLRGQFPDYGQYALRVKRFIPGIY